MKKQQQQQNKKQDIHVTWTYVTKIPGVFFLTKQSGFYIKQGCEKWKTENKFPD